MGARKKLNAAYFAGSLFLACVAGTITESWLVAIGSLAVLVSANIYCGEIRPPKRR